MKQVSFVIPCLNEEKSLPLVLNTLQQLKNKFPEIEIIVSDNGSSDRSVEIAQEFGAKVVHAKVKGYGEALKVGIAAAQYEIVCFADADFTYDFLESERLYQKLQEENLDLVVGDRLSGKIEAGAMPWLHQYVGTPVLSFLISHFYGNKPDDVRDSNSGFRMFRKQKFLELQYRTSGMEFASEMLIKFLKGKAKIGWVPVSLRKSSTERKSHLRTWQDGFRHLKVILKK